MSTNNLQLIGFIGTKKLINCKIVDSFPLIYYYFNFSGKSLVVENTNTKHTIHELEQYVETLRANKEKLRQELSDQWSQVARLKLEVWYIIVCIHRKLICFFYSNLAFILVISKLWLIFLLIKVLNSTKPIN